MMIYPQNQQLYNCGFIKDQVSKMDAQKLKYLQKDEIGRVIAKGLMTLFARKPEKPVRYLAEWLKNHSQNQKKMKQIKMDKTARQENLKVFNQAEQIAQKNKALEQKKQEEIATSISDFKKSISSHEYQEELLEETFPEFIQKHASITGAYIGELNHPDKDITDEDNDENAHLDTKAPKLIKYIGSSVSHKQLMRGETLALDKGITNDAFSLDQQKQVKGEEGQDAPKPQKKRYIYVNNVVKNDKIHYFKYPRLGSYLAVPLIYNSYLKQIILDDSLEQKLQYLQDLKEFQDKKKEEVEEIQKEIEEAQKNLQDLKEKNGEPSEIQEHENQISTKKEKLNEKKSQNLEEKEQTLTLEKRSFVVCVDNLGKDEEISQKNLEFIVGMVQHLRDSWENKECQLLKKDVETQVKYLNELNEKPANIKEEYEKELELGEQANTELQAIQNEKQRSSKKQTAEHNRFKVVMKEKQAILNGFLKLKQFRVVKYADLIQLILYFLGHTKQEINEPKKTTLNWKKVKQQLITSNTFTKIVDYTYEGPKNGDYASYCKVNYLKEQFDTFDESDIFQFNIGLGMITKFIKKALALRISNIEGRRAVKEAEKAKRAQAIQANNKIEEERVNELEKYKSELTPEALGEFKEEEWNKTFYEGHGLEKVGDEVVDEIDNDL